MADDDSKIFVDTVNVLLGKLALDQGWITPEQLKKALAEQVGDLGRGLCPVRPLGAILVAQGYLNSNQLVRLLRMQRERNQAADPRRHEETLLGRLLVKNGHVAQERVEECLRIQRQAIESDAALVPRLGELLVERGHTSTKAVSECLSLQAAARAVTTGA